jgi:hypothetical protein
MFFNLCFPAIDPWSDLEELLDPPEQPDAGRAPPPPDCAVPMPGPQADAVIRSAGSGAAAAGAPSDG